ncbi:protein kinase [Amycolatopsis rhabdoformis]|uniref:non-specific serine/threonine protein kinase n=1 Tax=Amycolatopsis rhabdoformis TaxID=1448059 RepID=A0ABZ1IHM0_9PSEU|nr:protein kinase [Amycolatopsis rhabdoformis]WSE33658.1 protein kinase [Amycolatopsis rhabdoformis]
MNDTWSIPGFTEVDVLGIGGFGRVVLAKHEESGQMVAIKYLRAEYLADARIADGFRREAWLLAGVRSPHVVRLFDFVETPDGAALVMEAVPGVSLRALLAAENVLAPESALAVLKGSLLGLADAHAAGVVHRDYKPGNVLVSGQGESKLVDFGLATLDGHNGLTAGSPSYMAPEQWSGQPGMPATDVYAATCVFYQCVTGQPPFRADTTEGMRALHQAAPVPLDAVPEGLRALITRGMAKDPAWRPATAHAFVTELETTARKAYGKNWEKRGWKRLATSAAALTALTPLALLAGAGTAAAPVGAGAVAAGVGGGVGGGVPATGAGATAVIAGKIAAAVLIVGALVAGGVAVFGNHDDPPPQAAALTVAMQTETGRDQALPVSYDLQFPQVSGGADPAVRQRINAALRAPVDKRLKAIRDGVTSYRDMFQERGDTAAAHTKAQILLRTPSLLSVRYQHDLDSDVLSHPTWRFPEMVNVDLGTGQALGPKDVFRPEVLTAAGMATLTQRLEPHTQSGFRTVVSVDGDGRKTDLDAADSVDGGDHVPAASFGFTETGLQFELLWYELGATTADGQETVTVPYGEVGDLLTPKLLTMVGKPGAASSASASAAPTSASAPPSSASAPSIEQTPNGPTYTNPRFGFTALISESFVPAPYSPPNGDGATFSNPDTNSTLTVWGANSSQSAAQTLAAAAAAVEADGGRVTYRKDEGDRYSLSGFQSDGKIFYERGFTGSASMAALRWVYPAEDKEQFDGLVNTTVEGFKPGDLSRPH